MPCAGVFRPPPGLEHLVTFPAMPMKSTLDEDVLSTTDEGGSSEHSFDMAACGQVSSDNMLQGKTTLMVRNVPVMYTQALLLEEWKDVGVFDFLYLPRTAGGQVNLSYAFINFMCEADAVAFQSAWQKKRLSQFTSRKPLNVSFAEVQGLHANVTQLRKKRSKCTDSRENQPLVLCKGEYQPLADVQEHFSF